MFSFDSNVLWISAAVLVLLYVTYKKMAKAGNPLFKIGYCLYAKTPIGQLYYRRQLAKAHEKYSSKGHSKVFAKQFDGFKIQLIAMSDDNYAYMIVNQKTGQIILVDPADPTVVLPYLKTEEGQLVAVLTTHKHWDHSGGNSEIKKNHPNVDIYGGALDSVPGCTHGVNDGDTVQVAGFQISVMFTPGHTVGHCVYLLSGAEFGAPDCLFSGDHLFLGGMGRMFEGSPVTMLRSLDKLSACKKDTLVFPGHEYALDNLQFAATLEPENATLMEKLDWVKTKRHLGECTSPSTLEEEYQYNPFLRSGQLSLIGSLGLEAEFAENSDLTRAKALAEIRARKDKFKYKL